MTKQTKEVVNQDLDKILVKLKRRKLNQLQLKVLKVKRNLNSGNISILEAKQRCIQYNNFIENLDGKGGKDGKSKK